MEQDQEKRNTAHINWQNYLNTEDIQSGNSAPLSVI